MFLNRLVLIVACLLMSVVYTGCAGPTPSTPAVQGTQNQTFVGGFQADCTPLISKKNGFKSACAPPCEIGQTSADGCIPTCVSEGDCATPPPSGGGTGGTGGIGTGGGGGGGCPVVDAAGGNIHRDTCGGGGGNGGSVATTTPYAGASCDGSPGQLGTTNLSTYSGTSQSGWATTVDDIWGLKQSPASTTAYAWIYETGGGAYFIQYNPQVGGSAASTWLGNVLQGVPGVGPALAATIVALVNTAANPSQLSAQQFNAIVAGLNAKNAASNGTGPVFHACFTAPLPPPQPGG